MYNETNFDHLPVLSALSDIAGFELVPDIIWIFDLDRHGFWWGNSSALKFWGLDRVQQLIDKDLSADTESARQRTEQTFYKAVAQGMTVDPWTTYPNGKPKTLMMRHKAVLLGPEKHRGIIAFISEEVNLGEDPETLIFAEAVRYTSVAVTSFTLQGRPIFENPVAAELYGYARGGLDAVGTVNTTDALDHSDGSDNTLSEFERRFADPAEGKARLAQAQAHQDGQQEHLMRTQKGIRRHAVNIRTSRHPLTGDYLTLVSEYDVTELHDALAEAECVKEELKKQAHYDALTGLPSLRLCKDRMEEAFSQAKHGNKQVALMFVDLDGFKSVNDNYGHDAGDQVLKAVGQRLSALVGAEDTVGRIGGDEFIIILPDISHKDDSAQIAERAIKDLSQPFQVEDEVCQRVNAYIGASVGIALYPVSGQSAEELLRAADQSMYQVKRAGKNNFCFASEWMA